VSFDGGSRGNPGVAGSGAHVILSRVVVLDPPQESRTRTVARSTIRLHRFLQGSQTNNQAEYWGLISGLECVYEQLQLQFKKEQQQQQVPGLRTLSLTIQGDSKLVVQQMNGAWKVGNILQSAHTTARTCLKRIQDLCKVHGVVLTYTLSHVYRTDNKAADGEWQGRRNLGFNICGTHGFSTEMDETQPFFVVLKKILHTECANLAMDSQRSWATSIDSDGEETRTDLSDVIPGS
jgi:ribonuclease HI